MFNRRFENQLMEYFSSLRALNKLSVLNLGGVSGPAGGSGGPPGGIIGQLAQSNVTYDTTEIATDATPVSGYSLVDNLNHIRYRIQTLENSPETIAIEKSGITVLSDAQTIDFDGDNITVIASGTKVIVTVSGGGTSQDFYLDDILDVNLITVVSGESLVYNGNEWINATISGGVVGGATSLDELTDVVITSPQESQVLTYSSGSWINANPTGSGGVSTFLGLADTPSTYTAASGYLVVVNDAETAVEFKDYSGGFPPESHSHSLDNLSDVVITLPSSGNLLSYDGTTWVNSVFSASGVTYPGNSVVAETSFSISPASGTSSLYSRADHTHGTPYNPPREVVFSITDEIETMSGTLRLYNQLGINYHISKVFLAVGTAPTGAAIIADVNRNGSSIFLSGNRPTIPSGSNTGYSTTIETNTFDDGDYLTLDIDQVGSTIAGSDLTAHITLVDTNI